MFKVNDMTVETRQELSKWHVKIVHDDGREIESTKPFNSEADAIDAAMRYCMSHIVNLTVTYEDDGVIIEMTQKDQPHE